MLDNFFIVMRILCRDEFVKPSVYNMYRPQISSRYRHKGAKVFMQESENVYAMYFIRPNKLAKLAVK